MRKYELENLIRKYGEVLYKTNYRLESIEEIQKTIQQTQEKGLVENKKLVIIYDKGNTRIYQDGKDITKGIRSITFNAEEIPTIEYEKVVY